MCNEMEQRSFYGDDFYGDAPPIINASEPHMACLLLLDTSGSMYGEPIAELNSGLNRFKDEVCRDKETRDILDIAIIEFNSTHNVVQEFVPVEQMKAVDLTANGGTEMSPAIQTAIDMVDERSRFYRRMGTEPYKPWIVMITDGAPTDNVSAIADVIHAKEEEGKLKFFALGVDRYDSRTLHLLAGKKVMKLREHDFTSFFNWVNKSMRSVSQSSPGEKVSLPNLPETVDKDVSDWGD